MNSQVFTVKNLISPGSRAALFIQRFNRIKSSCESFTNVIEIRLVKFYLKVFLIQFSILKYQSLFLKSLEIAVNQNLMSADIKDISFLFHFFHCNRSDTVIS